MYQIIKRLFRNDHAGPDDSAEKSGYTIRTFGNTSNGTLNHLYGGIFSYLPKPGFLGEDTFVYTIEDQGLSDSASVSLWIGKTASNPSWTYLRYFGAFMNSPETGKENWVYHTDMGWVYLAQPDQVFSSTWMWREYLGWFWTGERYFQWLYSDKFSKWFHWEGGISKGKAWFIRDENDLVLYEKDIIRMQVRDDVIEILPSLQILSDYVEGSSFFSRAERNAIVRELVLYNKSSTLNKILQFDFSY